MKPHLLAAVLVLVSGCASAGAPPKDSVVITLAKPDLVYVGGQAVAADKLRERLHGANRVVVVLDPEMKLSVLTALEEALTAAAPKEIEMKGSGRWILDAIVEQRRGKAAGH